MLLLGLHACTLCSASMHSLLHRSAAGSRSVGRGLRGGYQASSLLQLRLFGLPSALGTPGCTLGCTHRWGVRIEGFCNSAVGHTSPVRLGEASWSYGALSLFRWGQHYPLKLWLLLRAVGHTSCIRARTVWGCIYRVCKPAVGARSTAGCCGWEGCGSEWWSKLWQQSVARTVSIVSTPTQSAKHHSPVLAFGGTSDACGHTPRGRIDRFSRLQLATVQDLVGRQGWQRTMVVSDEGVGIELWAASILCWLDIMMCFCWAHGCIFGHAQGRGCIDRVCKCAVLSYKSAAGQCSREMERTGCIPAGSCFSSEGPLEQTGHLSSIGSISNPLALLCWVVGALLLPCNHPILLYTLTCYCFSPSSFAKYLANLMTEHLYIITTICPWLYLTLYF